MEQEHNSGDENSDDGLQIVVESPRPKRKTTEIDETTKKLIESSEQNLEENLDEKAAKANLTAKHVKNIIKEVVTNEHVLALVRHVENPENSEPVVYEPKFTRAKTKQFLSSTPTKVLPWTTGKKTVSEVQKLFTEELQEESSGDEYVPENQTANESVLDSSQATIDEEDANIALRTRSKLSLSHTPLEVIEEAFMPPDITTDMYDMDCDDDEWKEFLKTFTRPLDEVTKAAEDEDHDPEYNVLADEEIDEIDREELRADRAVTVSRKEFNCLMAELFEYADIYESNKKKHEFRLDDTAISEQEVESDENLSIKKCQIPILLQQMTQHVQMLTQSFLLSYEHPECFELAPKFKEMINDIFLGCEGKEASIYNTLNIKSAMSLIENWQNLLSDAENQDVADHRCHIVKTIAEAFTAKAAATQYVVTFSPLLLKTISESDVFLYPFLLPRVPFRPLSVTNPRNYFFSYGEESLLAMLLEQAISALKQEKNKKFNLRHVAHLIQKQLMPQVNFRKIYRFIMNKRAPESPENPIKFYFRNRKAPPTIHYVIPMIGDNGLPPFKRNPRLLPMLWRKYVAPDFDQETDFVVNNASPQKILVSYPMQLKGDSKSKFSANYAISCNNRRLLLPKGPLPELLLRKPRRVKRKPLTLAPVSYQEKQLLLVPGIDGAIEIRVMLPDMPSLGNTPIKSQVNNENKEQEELEQDVSFKNISKFLTKPEDQVKRNFESINEFSLKSCEGDDGAKPGASTEKDNLDDINELMKASATVKNVPKKEPSGAEKKRAKIRREFVANLIMATPEDPDSEKQKDESFADAYFDELKQMLNPDDYEKLIEILTKFDDSRGEASDLYLEVQTILAEKYPKLAEQFLLFLNAIQAQKVGQLMPYFLMKDLDRFVKKLNVYFKDQPTQMKKIIKSLNELAEDPDLTMDKIKANLIPLLKGNSALNDWFLQMFPNERPPKLLIAGPHEKMDISKELARQPEEEICETVILPDTEDPYGGSNCICSCHEGQNLRFTSRMQHCKNCGLKFIQGKMYIQTGKALRPAVVSFLTNPEKDHSKRLAATQRKRSDTSPNKQLNSPTKETTTEEHRHSNESEDDDGKKKNPKNKTPRKRKKSESTTKTKQTKTSPKRQNKKKLKRSPDKTGMNPGQQKQLVPDEPGAENVKTDNGEAENVSEFVETSSQDVTTVESEGSSSSESPKDVWTREEDKAILQAFKKSGDNEETFKKVSKLLGNRSVEDIRNRFTKLMNLLQQMTSDSSS